MITEIIRSLYDRRARANHHPQHSIETAVMLTSFGRPPGDLDLVVYLAETKS